MGTVAGQQGETIRSVKTRDTQRHPGPWRIMPINTEVAGLIVAVGFFLMGLVTLPILVLAAVPLGIAVALLLRYQRRA